MTAPTLNHLVDGDRVEVLTSPYQGETGTVDRWTYRFGRKAFPEHQQRIYHVVIDGSWRTESFLREQLEGLS